MFRAFVSDFYEGMFLGFTGFYKKQAKCNYALFYECITLEDLFN